MDRRIAIPIDCVTEENSALIVRCDTGVSYTDQCDGMACSHPEFEGYVLSVGRFGQDFDLCGLGCCELGNDGSHQLRKNAADAFNRYCDGKTVLYNCRVSFDVARIDELMENWIPVLLNGVIDIFQNEIFKDQQAILTGMGNCD